MANVDRSGELPRIVIVEDEDDDFIMVARLIQKAGVQNPITRFSGGADAIRYLQRAARSGELPCLILLDIKMPGLAGFDVLAWIRNQPELAELRVVMLSGSGEERDIRTAEQLGADRCLTKFPPAEKLRGLISDVCGASLARSPGAGTRKRAV